MAVKGYNPFRLNKGRAGSPVRTLFERWRAAQAWRAAVESALEAHGLTFNEWLVLAATHALTRPTDRGVNQSEVARAIGMDRMMVSRVMRSLVDRGCADRDVAGERYAYKFVVTAKGRRQLKQAIASVEAVSG